MRYCESSREMSPSYFFGLDVFCKFEARFPEFDALLGVQCKLYRGGGLRVTFWDFSANMQNKASPKYNDDISFLISQYLIPVYGIKFR